MEQTIKELVKLAKEWRDFSRETNGWSTETYESKGFSVWCYFAENSDHTSVRFRIEGFNSKDFSVSLYRPSVVNFTPTHFTEKFLIEGQKCLKEAKHSHTEKSKDAIAEKKNLKIEALKKQISSLEDA